MSAPLTAAGDQPAAADGSRLASAPAGALSAADSSELVGLALAAIAATLAGDALDGAAPASPALHAQGASFVTLESGGKLRGCIGSLEPVQPLYQDVTRNAVRALADPRVPPVTADDWPALDVSVAVLSSIEPLPCTTLEELLAALRPGVDGLTLSEGSRCATFLPKVWDKLPTPERFVSALLVKGGWPAAPWPTGLSAGRYTTAEYHDRAPRT